MKRTFDAVNRTGSETDRLDAMVWAITSLMAPPGAGPRVRGL
jgi:phage terminase large subunit-like protein